MVQEGLEVGKRQVSTSRVRVTSAVGVGRR
jgi:hypothetical protein